MNIYKTYLSGNKTKIREFDYYKYNIKFVIKPDFNNWDLDELQKKFDIKLLSFYLDYN